MTEREALKLALEALDGLIKKTSGQSIYSFMETERRIAMSACVGIREVLAQPEQEPVAWWRLAENDGHQKYPVVSVEKPHQQWTTTRPLVFGDTPPPQRTWVGLTDEEMDTEADKKEQGYGFIQGALWAEDKLKEKNT